MRRKNEFVSKIELLLLQSISRISGRGATLSGVTSTASTLFLLVWPKVMIVANEPERFRENGKVIDDDVEIFVGSQQRGAQTNRAAISVVVHWHVIHLANFNDLLAH